MNRKLAAVAVVGIIAAGALLFPTAAAPFTDDGEADTELRDIEMAPADTPNGVYAEIGEDDKIRLNLTEQNQKVAGDGVNGDAVTEIDNVFTITYTGDEMAYVWLTHDGPDADLTLYRDDSPTDSLEGESNNVTLASNETVSVSVLIDTRGDHGVEQITEFTVHAKLPEEGDTSTDTPTATPTDTPTATPTDTPTATPTDTPMDTSTPTDTPTDTTDADEGSTGDGSAAVEGADHGTPTPTATPDADAGLQGPDGGSGGGPDSGGLGQLLGGFPGMLLLLLLLLLLLGVGLAAALRTNLS